MRSKDIEDALEAVRDEYKNGRGPLVKFKEQNEKLIELTKNNNKLFRHLGVMWEDRGV